MVVMGAVLLFNEIMQMHDRRWNVLFLLSLELALSCFFFVLASLSLCRIALVSSSSPSSRRLQVITRAPGYRGQYVHRRDSVSVKSLEAHEYEARAKVGLITEGDESSDEDYDEDYYEEVRKIVGGSGDGREPS